MTRCILNVTDDEFNRILQLNHDSLVWSNHNRVLMHSLQQMFDPRLMHDLRQYDFCRMQKHDDLRGIERVERDTRKEFVR